MADVCTACHTRTFSDGHFYQFDASVRLYNEKFAIPATDLMKLVRERKLLENPASFSNKIEWTYWELWHHEGRRARHGAAMMGPDYTWWHGFYDIAQHFYFKLLPEARELGDPEVDAFVDNILDSDPMHQWVREQTDDLKKQIRSGDMQKIYARFFVEELSMLQTYLDFIRAVSLDRLGRIGVVLTTTAFISFVVFQIAMLSGIVTNAYVGLIVYLLFPVLFVLGLCIIPIAWHRQRKRTGLSASELLAQRFGKEGIRGDVAGSKVFRTVAIFTLANVLILGTASVKMLHFMDSARFCGTACHSVMSPEWATYQASPHARVACVECHVGEGVGALVNSKLNGAWQMVSAALDLYERPIPTPVHQLRPARETCEKCHWPDKFYGSRLETRVSYENDEASTPRYTTLNLKIDAGAAGSTGVHWHVDLENEVRYRLGRRPTRGDDLGRGPASPMATSDATSTPSSPQPKRLTASERAMDCVDCHNRATHVYEEPGRAVDERIRLGGIDRTLPLYPPPGGCRCDRWLPIARSRPAGHQGRPGELLPPKLPACKRRHGTTGSMPRSKSSKRSGHETSTPGCESSGAPTRASSATPIPQVVSAATHATSRIPRAIGSRTTAPCVTRSSPTTQIGPFAYLEPAPEKSRNRPMHIYLREEFLASTSH